VRHQHGVLRKGMKRGQHGADVRLAGHHVLRDAVDGNGCGRNQPARVHQLLEGLLPQQLAVDDAGRPDLDDLVAAGRIEPGGLGVEHGEGQRGQRLVVECAALLADLEQVKIVVLGPALVVHDLRGFELLLLAGQRQQKTEKSLVPHALALEPHLAAVALDHVAHRQRRALGAETHRVHFPRHDGLGAHHLPRPDQIELRALADLLQPQLQKLHVEFIDQPAGQVGQHLQQREAFDLEPQAGIGAFDRHAAPAVAFDLALGGGHEIAAEHFLQRPAGLEPLGRALHQVGDAPAHGGDFLAHHAQEAFAHLGLQVGVTEHVDRSLHVGQGRAAALGQAVQQLVAHRRLLEALRHVVEHQHKAADAGPRLGA